MNGAATSVKITVCIATYKRPQKLLALLEDVAGQSLPCSEIVVVDNDPAQSARAVVEEFASRLGNVSGLSVRYDVQPVKNISLTRNKTIELATGDWLAFADDDERAPKEWLALMMNAATTHKATGILGPVVPVVPADAPAWIRRGQFYDLPRARSGQAVPANNYKFGNVLLQAESLRAEPGPFDPAYGTTGGEDGDLLCRLELKGAKLIWSDEAVIEEPVDPTRLSARWLWMRAMRGGQDFARHTAGGRYGKIGLRGKLIFLSRALLQLFVAAVLAVVSLPFGLHRAMRWVLKVAANFGKLSYFWGWHYHEYA